MAAVVVDAEWELGTSVMAAFEFTVAPGGGCAFSSLVWGDPGASTGPRRAYGTVYQREQGCPAGGGGSYRPRWMEGRVAEAIGGLSLVVRTIRIHDDSLTMYTDVFRTGLGDV